MIDPIIIRLCTVAEIERAPNIGALLDEYASEVATGALAMLSRGGGHTTGWNRLAFWCMSSVKH